MKALFNFLLLTALPSAAFYGGFRLTDVYFREKLVPFPFEIYGLAAGAGCFFWTLSVLTLVLGKRPRK